MAYDTYKEKWLWDTPMKGLVDETTGILLPNPPTLRQRRLGSVVHHSGFDIEKHVNSEDGMMQARQWHNVEMCIRDRPYPCIHPAGRSRERPAFPRAAGHRSPKRKYAGR